MKAALLVFSIMAAVLLAPLALDFGTKVAALRVSTETLNEGYAAGTIPSVEQALKPEAFRTIDVQKTITLEARNTVTLRGPVTPESVSTAMKKLRQVSRSVSKDTPIYLVLDTPGGSIMDGLDLIDFAQALPQKVHTVTLFAASMGFMIAQNLDTRYIIRTGTLMSHRASVSGLGGQVKGELESRYRMIRRAVDYLDVKAAKRLGMELAKYEDMIVPEYWVHGYDAVTDKAADEQILVRCGESLDGSETVSFDTFFGPVKVTFSQCPLMKAPESIDLSEIGFEDRNQVKQVFKLALEDKRRFVNDYVTTGRFFEVFR